MNVDTTGRLCLSASWGTQSTEIQCACGHHAAARRTTTGLSCAYGPSPGLSDWPRVQLGCCALVRAFNLTGFLLNLVCQEGEKTGEEMKRGK
jgi:hypothetical protein